MGVLNTCPGCKEDEIDVLGFFDWQGRDCTELTDLLTFSAIAVKGRVGRPAFGISDHRVGRFCKWEFLYD